jgi:hypothetical protein
MERKGVIFDDRLLLFHSCYRSGAIGRSLMRKAAIWQTLSAKSGSWPLLLAATPAHLDPLRPE